MKIIISSVILLLCSANATAADDKNTLLCEKIYKVAASAIIAKKNGFTKDKLLSAIPSDDVITAKPITQAKLVLISMKLIANEVFGYDNLDYWAYPGFKAEICVRQFSKKPTHPKFLKYYPDLLKCNNLQENKRLRCGMDVANHYDQ